MAEQRPKCQRFPDCGARHFSHEPCKDERVQEKVRRPGKTKLRLQKGKGIVKGRAEPPLEVKIAKGRLQQSQEKVAAEQDWCPMCGTNLAAKRKEKVRRRSYMKKKRAGK